MEGKIHCAEVTAIAFGWWFVLLFLNTAGRLLLVLGTMVAWVPWVIVDRLPNDASIRAAQTLRTMQQSLDVYRDGHPEKGYPATISAFIPADFPFRYYQLKYIPLRAEQDGPFTRFALTAIPLRPSCISESFTVSEDAVVRSARGREATLTDPPL